MVKSRSLFVVVVLGILILKTSSAVQAADSLCVLQDLPASKTELAQNACFAYAEPLPMAAGEAEGMPVRFTAEISDAERSVQFQADLGNGIEVRLYQVGWIPGTGSVEGGVPDPLIPLANGDTVTLVNQDSLLWVNVKTSPATPPGTYVIPLSVADSGSKNILAELQIPVKVSEVILPAELSTVVEGNIRNNGEPTRVSMAAMRLLSSYRFNGVAGMTTAERILEDPEKYLSLVQVAFDELNFYQVRIPSLELYSANRSFSSLYGNSDAAYEQWATKQQSYFDSLASILLEPRWNGRFAYKIWDEPKESQYPQVRRLYDTMHGLKPDLKLELTEHFHPEFGESIDIWIPNVKSLSAEDATAIHDKGESMWFYSNYWHGIDQPSYVPRTIGWALWNYKLDGYYFWSVNMWSPDPWTTISSDYDNYKRATLVYPHPETGLPIPSLRLEAFRDGIEDMYLLRLLENRGGSEAIIQSFREMIETARRNYNSNPPDFRAWHAPILNALSNISTLMVTLSPQAAIADGAQWRVDGGPWKSSGEMASGLSAGEHLLEFKEIADLTAPLPQSVSISDGQIITATASYLQTGLLVVQITPQGAIDAGAQWQVDGGVWKSSGEVVSRLPIGEHTVEFSSVQGWAAPEGLVVTIENNVTTTSTGYYEQQWGNLTVNFSPPSAVDAGVQWKVDGSLWKNSGEVLFDLPVGEYLVEFKPVDGWITPPGQYAIISKGQTTTLDAAYALPDSDWDGILDEWEVANFNSLAQDGTADYDADGLTDLQEYINGTNPKTADTDGDDMPDGWEVLYGIDPLVNDASLDLDGDGYSNYQEHLFGTDPNDVSSKPRALGPDLNLNLHTDLTVWSLGSRSWSGQDLLTGAGFDIIRGVPSRTPFVGDFDGDGKTDMGVWRAGTGFWYILLSSKNYSSENALSVQWGMRGDVPVPGDYDGNGVMDLAVWRPSNGTWYIKDVYGTVIAEIQWGMKGDVPIPGDYDGDGLTDLGIWRPRKKGTWYLMNIYSNVIAQVQWGVKGEVPVPADFDGDGLTDLGLWQPMTGTWCIKNIFGSEIATLQLGSNGDIPLAGDYDGDNRADIAIWRPGTGQWFIQTAQSDFVAELTSTWGLKGDLPIGCSPFSALRNYLTKIRYYTTP